MAIKRFSDELAIISAQNIEEEKYWLRQLSEEPVKCSFPYDYLKKTKCEHTIDILTLTLPHQLFSRLMSLTNCSDLRMFITMTAGLVVLLNKYTHQQDIIIGTTIYKQNMEVEFINKVLALRNTVEENISFKELLMQVGKVIFEANKHQNCPIETLLHLLNLPYVEDEDFPLFDIAILLENLHEPRYIRHIHPNMIFIFKITGEKMVLKVEYNSLLYMKSTINRITTHFINLLTKAVFNVDFCLADIDVLSKNEKHEILFEFNDTKAVYSRNKTMHLLFEEQVEKTPDNTAVISMKDVLCNMAGAGYPHPRTRENLLTYNELNKKSNQLARELKKAGVKLNSFVGVVMDRSMEMLIGVMAILKAGGAYVPLEPYLPDTRIVTCLALLNVEFVLTNRLQSGKIEKISEQLPELKHIFWLDKATESDIEKNSGDNLISTAAASDIAYVIFTSGTTGVPKGVVEQHRPVINIIEWVNNTFQIGGWEKLLFVASLSFDLSVFDIFGILAAGGSIRMVGSEEMKLPDRLFEVIFEEGITFWDSAPAAFQLLIPFVMEHKENRPSKSSGLRLVFLSGDWIPVTMPDLLKEVFKGVNVIALGGATEATIWSNFYPTGSIDPNWKSIPYGKPIQNAKYYIIDQQLHPCLIGVPGDLYIGGECLASGYINDIELTANKFVYNPFVAGETIYRTGDMARWYPDGNIEFLGRRDNQVKIRGFRIEPGEIERRLLTHDDINETIVTALESENGDKYLCAYITCTRPLSVSELKEYLAVSLPDYMIPAYFVSLESMPLSNNGKVDLKQLPPPAMSMTLGEYEAPRNWVEKQLVEIWAEVLGTEKDSIGIDGNFFELGGHSLNAMLLVSMIHKIFSVKIPLQELFIKPKIRELSEHIKRERKEIYMSIERAEEKEYYTLSPAQKRLYILQQMGENNIAYNMSQVFPLVGEVDKEKLIVVFERMIARHETLRTSFEMIEGEPVQKIHKNVHWNLWIYNIEESDWSNVEQDFKKSFDLSIAPLLKVGLVEIKSPFPYYYLRVEMHHIISDEVSQTLLQKEFMALSSGKELPPLRLQYKDFSQWENGSVHQEAVKKQEAYWLKQFEGELPVLNLPLDFPRPVFQSNEGCTVSFHLSFEDSAALRTIAREEEVTVFMLLLVAYSIFLAKLCCQEDIILGVPVAGRKHSDLQKIIGVFINSLALRNFPGGEKTVREFLKEVKANTLEAFENQEYPFEELVKKILVERDAGRNPIFDVMLNLLNQEDYLDMIPDDSGRDSYTHIKRRVRFDMNLVAVDFDEQIYCIFSYCTALFKPQTIDRFIGYFNKIVSQLPGNLDRRTADIEIIPEAEKKRLLHDFNASAADYPRDKVMIQLFEEQVSRTPHTVALVFEDNSVTYKQLNEQANRLGRLLRSKGIRPDTLISVMVERSVEMVLGIWGVLKAGGAYLPVSHEAPGDRIAYMLDNASVNILLTQEKYTGKFTNRYQVINLNSPASYQGSGANLGWINTPTDLAYVIYTSGSSGKPKGVMIQNRSVINIVKWFAAQYDLKPGFQLLQMFQYTFDASINQIFGSLMHGVTLHVIREEYFFDIEFLRDYIVKHFINLINFVQSVIKEMLCGREKIESLDYVISGAEKLKSIIKNEILDNGYTLYNQYGPTEVTVDALAEKCSYESNGTVGVPVYNAQCYIVNTYGRINPLGVAGELWVSGDGLARGYINNVQLTVEKFIHNPFIPGSKVYRTGDLTRWLPGGNIEFLGRIDSQVKIRGFRIEPLEIANQLVKIDGIKEAVVIDREDLSGETYLCSYLVGEEDAGEIEADTIKSTLSRSLPDYMIPLYFVQIERLPLSGHGKLIRSALPDPEMSAPPGDSYAAPSNHLERKLLKIWSDVLNRDKQIIGVESDFFELGGHSLRAARMTARIHKELHVKIPLSEVFKNPIIKHIAGYIKGAVKKEIVSLERLEKKEYYPVSSQQKRLFILQQGHLELIAYNRPNVYISEIELDKEKLEAASRKLIRRHESLRTSFDMIDGEPVQRIHSEVPFAIEHDDGELTPMPPEHFVQPFDLSQAPLLRVRITTADNGQNILMVDIHHIISDGASDLVLISDFMALYEEKQLPALALQYKDFSHWQNRLSGSAELKKQENYWLEVFADEIPKLDIPRDYPDSSERCFEGSTIYIELDHKDRGHLNDLAKQEGTTLFMLLLACYNVLLAKLGRNEDIVVGIGLAGRRRVDFENVIGMFVNTLALRNYPAEDKTFKHFLQEVKERTLLAFENQDYLFEELVKKVVTKSNPGQNPVFDTAFMLQNIEYGTPDMDAGNREQPQLMLRPYQAEAKTTIFDIAVFCKEIGGKLGISVSYSTGVFKKETIEKYFGYYKDILSFIIGNKELTFKLKDIHLTSGLKTIQSTLVQKETGDFGF